MKSGQIPSRIRAGDSVRFDEARFVRLADWTPGIDGRKNTARLSRVADPLGTEGYAPLRSHRLTGCLVEGAVTAALVSPSGQSTLLRED